MKLSIPQPLLGCARCQARAGLLRCRLIALCAVLAFFLSPAPAPAQAPADFSQPGPYQAGWTDVTVTRPDGSAFAAKLFYPATEHGLSATYDGSGSPYAAVSFGHGWLGNPEQYQSTLEHLATWGYLVIASRSYGGLFPDHSKFANDLLDCLDFLQNKDADPTSWLYQQVDTAHFGLSGHSMGGGASIIAAARDSRIRALANLAAAETTPSARAAMQFVFAPVRLIVGSADTIVPASTTRTMYDNGRPPRQFSNIQGGGHCGFQDAVTCDTAAPLPRSEQLAIARRLLTEFFNLYLKGDQGPWRQVWGPELDDDPNVVMTVDAGMALLPALQTGSTWNGASASYVVEIRNTGLAAAGYALLSEGNAWPVTFSPHFTPVLAPGQSATVGVEAAAPPEGAGGSDSALVSARSNIDGGTRAYGVIGTDAQAFVVGIAPDGGSLVLSWPQSAAACQYEIYRSTTPYFAPGPATLIKTEPAGTAHSVDSTPGVVGDVVNNHTYVIRAVCGDSAVDGRRQGEFDFSLQGGS